MSQKYELVKSFYEQGNWPVERVRDAVGRWITEEEYETITGQPYSPPEG